jgi:hypothetical protein
VLFLLTHNWIWTNRGGGGAKFSWAQGRKIPKYGPGNNNHFPYFNSITNINPILGIATAVEIWYEVQWLHKSRGIRWVMFLQEHPLTIFHIFTCILLNDFIPMVKPVLYTGIIFDLTTVTSHFLVGYFTYKTFTCSKSVRYDTCLWAEGKHFHHLP